MTAVLMRARSELRARIKPMLALTLLVGIGGGAVMALAAGARRTDTAYPRFARAYKAADMIVYPSFGEQFASLDFKKVAALPQIAATAVQHMTFAGTYAISADEPPYGSDLVRYKVLEGRLPHPNSIDEALIPLWLAQSHHVHVGSALTFNFATNENSTIPIVLHIVGIEAAPGEFPPQNLSGSPSTGGTQVHISASLFKELDRKNVFHLDFLAMRLKRGAKDVTAVNDELNAMAVDAKGNHLPQLNDNLNVQAADVQRSIHLQAVALWLVAGLAALIIVLVLSQLLARQATIDSTESATLQALGMTRTQVWLTGMGRALLIGMFGAAIAVAGAFFASRLMPIGLARVAEPNPGFSFDAALLGTAALAVIVIVLGLAAWPIWRNSRVVRVEAQRATKPGLAARTAAAPGFSPSVATGLRLALESGRGRTEVPVRSSLFSVILAIVALVGALTFGASLNHLINTPRLYGWNWDEHITTDGAFDNSALVPTLKADPRVQDVANIDTPPLLTQSKLRFDVIGIDNVKGRIEPVLIDGHIPQLDNEVALGVKTLKQVHRKIGDSIQLSISAIAGSIPRNFKIVGTIVVPPYSSSATLGTGATMTEAAIDTMAPPGFEIPPPSDLYMSFAPGVDHKKALADILATRARIPISESEGAPQYVTEAIGKQYSAVPPAKPTDLVNFGNVQNLPLLLAGLVGLLAAATLAHTLVTSIRRRRRDLAILKMLGFVPGQVRWAVAWQATTFVCTALLIGLPIGVAVGRVVWSAFATNLGTVPEPVTPSVSLFLTIPGAILLANLIAIAPAFVAGRMRPAPALRAE